MHVCVCTSALFVHSNGMVGASSALFVHSNGMEYLCHESHSESPLVIVAGWNSIHDSGTGIVGIRGPASTTGQVDDIRQCLGV